MEPEVSGGCVIRSGPPHELISQGKALDKGMVMVADSKKFERDGKVLMIGHRDFNLYKMMFQVIIEAKGYAMSKETKLEGNSEYRRWIESENSKHQTCILDRGNASQMVSLSTWHERLDHQNIGYVKKFLKHHNISNSQRTNNFFVNRACMESNIVHLFREATAELRKSVTCSFGCVWTNAGKFH